MKHDPRYVSYLLRVWATEDEEETIWRASLESPRTGARFGFATLEELFAFIAAQTATEEEAEISGRR